MYERKGKMAKKLKWHSVRWRVVILVWVLVLTALGYVGCCLRPVIWGLPVGTGPAGPAVPREPFQRVWSDERIVLAGLGDSITKGYGAPAGKGYFDLLRENDDAHWPDMKGCDLENVFGRLEAYNYSQNYTVSREHIEKQLPLVPGWGPDVKGIVVITSGGNDLIHNYGRTEPKDGAMYGCTYEQGLIWIENIKQRLQKLLERVMEKFPGGCEIFLANIYDPTDGVGDPYIVGFPRWPDCVKVLGLTNRKIAQLCDSYENVHLVDIHSEFLGHGIHCTEFWRRNYHKDDPGHWYDRNLEDPNPRGYDAIRRLFLIKMIETLPERFTTIGK